MQNEVRILTEIFALIVFVTSFFAVVEFWFDTCALDEVVCTYHILQTEEPTDCNVPPDYLTQLVVETTILWFET